MQTFHGMCRASPVRRPSSATLRMMGLLVVTSILGCAPADEPPPPTRPVRMHDHSPHHGGVVSMAGGVHVEVAAQPDGQVRVYLSDLRRRPLAPDAASGSVVLALADDQLTLPLTHTGEGLEARGPVLPVGDLRLRLELVHERRALDLNVVVPVGIAPGLVGLARECTAPLGPVPRGELLPRCTVDFPRMVRALAVTPDDGMLLVAVFARGVSLWRLPAMEAIGALDPIPSDDGDHGHEYPVDALAVRADGREAAVAVRFQILRYALPGGKLLRTLQRDHSIIHALAYTPEGRHLVATKLVDGTIEMLDAEDGSQKGTFRAGHPLAAAAFATDGSLAVAASELGPLSLFVPPSTTVHQVLDATLPARAMALAGEHLATVTDDGMLAFWTLRDGKLGARTPSASSVITLAARPGSPVLATGCQDGAVRIYTLPAGRLVRTLRWHTTPVQALAWAGDLLASGDTRGGLALWSTDEIVGENAG